MDVSYYKEKYEPINGKWYIKELLGEGSYGKVFRIEHIDAFNKKTEAALKVITIPQSEKEIESVRETLQDDNSVSQYFKNMTSKITEELDVMAQLKGNTNIVSYEEHDIFPHDNGIGYDILIRMELLKPLNKLTDNISEQEVIKLGIDICKALEVCQKYNIVHRDIKPENIFVSSLGDYKLGDFGVARTMKHEMTVMTTTGTYVYMAPELKKGEECGTNVDIYSLGMVMYKLLNYNREPFLPLPPEMFTFEQREQAMINRMKGMPLPKPAKASERLAEIILKACEYNPKIRYESPMQMRTELENLVIAGKGSVYSDDEFLPEENFIPTLYASPYAFGNGKSDDDRTTGLFVEPPIPEDAEKTELDETVGMFGQGNNVEPNTYKLALNRTSAKERGGISVYVDEKLVAKGVCDANYEIELASGQHIVELKPTYFENEYETEIDAGENEDAKETLEAIKEASVRFNVSREMLIDYSISWCYAIKMENESSCPDEQKLTPPENQTIGLDETVGIFDKTPDTSKNESYKVTVIRDFTNAMGIDMRKMYTEMRGIDVLIDGNVDKSNNQEDYMELMLPSGKHIITLMYNKENTMYSNIDKANKVLTFGKMKDKFEFEVNGQAVIYCKHDYLTGGMLASCSLLSNETDYFVLLCKEKKYPHQINIYVDDNLTEHGISDKIHLVSLSRGKHKIELRITGIDDVHRNLTSKGKVNSMQYRQNEKALNVSSLSFEVQSAERIVYNQGSLSNHIAILKRTPM